MGTNLARRPIKICIFGDQTSLYEAIWGESCRYSRHTVPKRIDLHSFEDLRSVKPQLQCPNGQSLRHWKYEEHKMCSDLLRSGATSAGHINQYRALFPNLLPTIKNGDDNVMFMGCFADQNLKEKKGTANKTRQ